MSKYDEIINLPHFEPKYHKRMSIYNRSAQFAPFAALTGYNDAVKETARLTDSKIDLSEEVISMINLKLQIIETYIKERPNISVIYFESDKRKSGGKYLEYNGNIKRIDSINNTLLFEDGMKISINNLVDINSQLIKDIEI